MSDEPTTTPPAKKSAYKRTGKPVGRRPKISDEIIALAASYVGQGVPYKDAALLAGISEPTFHEWRAHGRDDDENGRKSKYQEFFKRIAEEEAKLMQKMSLAVTVASKDDWRAAAWILERRRPKEYGRQDTTQVVGKDGGPVQTTGGISVALVVRKDDSNEPSFTEGEDELEDPAG